MKPLAYLIAALLLGTFAVSASAADGLPPVEKPVAKAGPSAPMPGIFDSELRIAALEQKVAELDRTKVTAAQARAIAKEEIAKVTVALQGSNGQIRTQQVAVNSNYQGGFDLQPGETLAGYEDPMTGQYVDLSQQKRFQRSLPRYSQPVQYYQSPNATFAQPPAAYGQPRRTVFRARQPLQQWMATSCANGQCG